MRLSPRPGIRRWAVVLAFAASVAVAGCGATTGKVTGKVTYKGSPLKGGNVTFLTPDGKKPVSSVIGEDGAYTVEGVPVGEVKITVETKSLKQQANHPSYQPPPGMTPPGGYKPPDPAEALKHYVEIPEGYSNPDTSGLTYTVKPGSQPHDIELK